MTRTRAGFTLVELLVAMSLAIVLAGLAVAVAESGAFGSQKVVSAGDRASGWLLIAKQRAVRDQRPRGVRFLLSPDPQAPGSASPNDYRNYAFTAREAQYIEVPDAWVPDRTKPVAQRAFLAYVYTSGNPMTYVSGTNSDPNYYPNKSKPNPQRLFVVLPDPTEQAEFLQRVSAGNLLTLPAVGATFRIDQLYNPSAYGAAKLSVNGVSYTSGFFELVLGQLTDRPPPTTPLFTYPDLGAATSGPTGPTNTQLMPAIPCATEYNFAFTAGFSGGASGTGGPLPLVGEPILQLSGNSVIDFRAAGPAGYNPATDPYSPTPMAPYYPRTSSGLALAGPAGGRYVDVLFSPAGQVLGASEGLVMLWVRDPDKAAHPRLDDPKNNNGLDNAGANSVFDAAGEQVLVTVYARTGLIATHPVTKGQDPFAAARDGLNSGL